MRAVSTPPWLGAVEEGMPYPGAGVGMLTINQDFANVNTFEMVSV